jgi:hypothetical protein
MSSRSSGQEEKLMTKVVLGCKGRVKGRWRVETASLEGGVHPSVEFYNLKCFIPLQFGTDPMER